MANIDQLRQTLINVGNLGRIQRTQGLTDNQLNALAEQAEAAARGIDNHITEMEFAAIRRDLLDKGREDNRLAGIKGGYYRREYPDDE